MLGLRRDDFQVVSWEVQKDKPHSGKTMAFRRDDGQTGKVSQKAAGTAIYTIHVTVVHARKSND